MVRAIGLHEQVDMRVDEAGQHRFAAQIDHLRVPVTCAAYLVIAAHRQDAPARAIDSHRSRAWLSGIHCIDGAVYVQVNAHSFSRGVESRDQGLPPPWSSNPLFLLIITSKLNTR